jgi:predicted outer membrane protein
MDYAAKYYKNASPANKKKFNSLVSDLRIDMSLDSAISEGLRQMRQEIKTTSGGKKFNTGGFINMKDYYKGML